MNDLASYIDHTLLKPDAVARDIEKLCIEACENSFFGVCIHGSWISHACRLLSGTGIAVVSVAGCSEDTMGGLAARSPPHAVRIKITINKTGTSEKRGWITLILLDRATSGRVW